MPRYTNLILASGVWIWPLFAFAFGACAGSLINVLVYRLPLGMSVVTPASRCPACGTRLTWRENIPVLGWLLLRGRCRFCRSRISPEYPMVEALVGFIFAGLFIVWYILPEPAMWLGIDWSAIRPEWAMIDAGFDKWPRQSWPMFIVLLVLAASLVAMSLVDLKTYTIPLQIPWFATIVALVFHVGYALYLSLAGVRLQTVTAAPSPWSIPISANWWWCGACLGAIVGLVLGNIFLAKGWMRRSFADYTEWETQHFGESPMAPDTAEAAPERSLAVEQSGLLTEVFPWYKRFRRFMLVLAGVAASLTTAGSLAGPSLGLPPWSGRLAAVLVGPLIAAAAIRPLFPPGSAHPPLAPSDSPPSDTWIQYPHARREMVKEILFLTPAIALGWGGASLAVSLADGRPMPLWVSVLTGVLMGYLIGGGVVWAFRIIGSLGFGKEALGLGDVHLMAAVGACLGWIDATLAFPLAAIVGLYWVVVHAVATGRMPRAMQFGPYLAGATALVVLGKPLIELGLTRLLAIKPPEPPVNLP